MLNLCIFMGRITADPELKKVGENEVCNFDIALDSPSKNENGEHNTTFVSIVSFGNVAKTVATYLHKGSKIIVRGALQQRNYLAKDGTKRTVYELLANAVEFLDQKPVEVKEDDEPLFDPHTGKPLKPNKK